MKHTHRDVIRRAHLSRRRVYLASAAAALGALTTVAAEAAAPPPPPPPYSGGAGDRACLRELTQAGVPFVERGDVRGIRTPVEVVGPIGGVRLIARGKRPALMDCALARSLVSAAPLFRQAGVTGLSYSAAYDYRTRRGSTELSEHAHGLAIDVHAFETTQGRLDVLRDFSREPALRALADNLERHPSFRLILTPDDDRDHRDHFHIESHQDSPSRWLSQRVRRSSPASARGVTHAGRTESGRTVRRRHHDHHHHSRWR